ncbi:proline-rich protein 19 [Falco naumanni]|uniref:proline-rich protein 19 n=1 Tax=Falco naumanni TaxID=148594 RepID=UPI001ADE6864|nr:proline-rich protein 19 [Falco naumanni]
MSPHSSRGNVVRDGGGPHPRGALHPTTNPPRLKRRKTKRERDAAKFGRKIPPPGGGQRGAKLPFLWRGRHPPASPLLLPKTVVITQSRLCQHRGLFNHEVKSVDVERLLSPQQDVALTSKTPQLGDPSPAPEGDLPPAETPLRPPEAPQKKEGQHARELASRICAILARVPVFLGCDLAGERRRAIIATLLQQHQTLPDLSFLLAHRNHGADTAAQGQWSPRTPEQELSTERGDFREQECRWDTTPPYASPLGPLQAIRNETLTYPTRPATPRPIFGSDAKKKETPFSWTSGGEDSQCPDSPAVLFQPRGELPPSWGAPCQRGGPQPHGGLLPSSSPPAYTCGGPSIGQSRTPPPAPPRMFSRGTLARGAAGATSQLSAR